MNFAYILVITAYNKNYCSTINLTILYPLTIYKMALNKYSRSAPDLCSAILLDYVMSNFLRKPWTINFVHSNSIVQSKDMFGCSM